MNGAFLGRILETWWRALDLVYPGSCACCDAACGGRDALCPACRVKLAGACDVPACPRCGAPLAAEGLACAFCRGKGLPPLESIVRLGLYHHPLRKLVQQFKYHRRWGLGEFLADCLAAQPAAASQLARAQCLVAVPLHWKRQWRRGYNQAAVVAHRLARRFALPIVRPAVRIRDTPTQTQVPASQRQANLRGAFALLRPRAIAGRRVVLVDDVLTSGATLRALASALAPAGPASMHGLVLALADPRGSDFEAA